MPDLATFAAALRLPPEELEAALSEQRRSLPWYAEAVAAVGGWLAALFLTVAVGSVLSFTQSTLAFGLLGAMITAAGAAGHRKFTGAFGHQFALALVLAGQTMMVGAVGAGMESLNAAAVVTVMLAVVLVPLIGDRMHQFLTVLAAVVMPLAALLVAEVPYALQGIALLTVPAGVALLLYPTRPLDTRPTAFVLLLTAPICDAVAGFAASEGVMLFTGYGGRLAYVIGLAWPIALLWPHLERPGRLLAAGALAAAVTAALLLPSGLVAGLLFMVLAYAVGSRLLAGLGVALEVFFMTRYYYDLRLDLLNKSILLAVIGAVLLGLWVAWRRLAEARP